MCRYCRRSTSADLRGLLWEVEDVLDYWRFSRISPDAGRRFDSRGIAWSPMKLYARLLSVLRSWGCCNFWLFIVGSEGLHATSWRGYLRWCTQATSKWRVILISISISLLCSNSSTVVVWWSSRHTPIWRLPSRNLMEQTWTAAVSNWWKIKMFVVAQDADLVPVPRPDLVPVQDHAAVLALAHG